MANKGKEPVGALISTPNQEPRTHVLVNDGVQFVGGNRQPSAERCHVQQKARVLRNADRDGLNQNGTRERRHSDREFWNPNNDNNASTSNTLAYEQRPCMFTNALYHQHIWPKMEFPRFYGDDPKGFITLIHPFKGEIETEFSQLRTERVLKEFLTYRNSGPLFLPKGKLFGHSPDTPIVLPSWLTEEDVKYYTNKFDNKGFTGGLNYYQNLDRNWELTAPWSGEQVKVPVKFIVGDQDLTYNSLGTKDYIHKGGFKKNVPFLEEVVVMERVAHFINQEKPDEINKHIHDFLQKF